MDILGKLKNKKILLVDDDEWIRNSLRLFFESEGCHLTALETAEEGMELLKRENYKIVITDYRLPGMDGIEFLKRIQASHPDTIKILITAYGSKDVFLAARKIGVQDFIDKPFTAQTIEESLARAIANHEQENL